MAAMSSTAPGATTLTPPSSSHGNGPAWKSSYASGYDQDPMQDRNFASGYETTNGAVHDDYDDIDPFARQDPSEPFPATKVRNGGRSTSRPDNKRGQSHSSDPGPTEDSKWIHRDKLAKIENAELQAAGIVLPKPRSQSRPRRERSTEKLGGGRRPTDASDHQPLPRSRKNSTQTSIAGDRHPDTEWDLRPPQEIAESPDEYWISSDTLSKGSRIPIAKQSPGTFPIDSNDRNGKSGQKTGGSVSPDDDFSLAVSKPRSRSGSTTLNATTGNHQPRRSATTDNSPPKKTPAAGARKPSAATAKSTAAARPKTRSGSGKDAGNTARPTTRSGELSPKAPEGDPPWMISAYKPDPRLPPDQQLLPTVAKRLQQEKWEKEGKFGNVYDKEFRPLNDEGFTEPPELPKPQVEDKQDEWPLRADAKSPTLSRPGTSSYSTMPRIQDTPAMTPLASPRLPSAPPQPQPQQPIQVTRVPTAPEEPEPQQPSEKEKKKEAGCGCCVVM
ncbi:hypothetical protein G7054_g7614 [Neopestalotiopsis clavispora]|nr:hypothetical protein E8E14_006028 [Neopestalotiopsis sp. 37M]KAF7532813.1 hypothetical protein G7054_g7614 [Neopestalotiopsis clavispora]